MHDPFLNQSQDRGGPAMPSLKEGQWLFNRRYELVRKLGAGGMGVVWLARDHTEETQVALKFLPAVLVQHEGEMKRLKEEVRAGKELRHPGIVATYALELEDSTAAIVMEYVEGKTLAELLEAQKRGFFEPEEITGWVREIAAAVDYLHADARRIHRDLKPANILVDAAGRARLMDFGISRRVQEGVTRQSRSVVPPSGGSESEPAKAGTTKQSSSTLAYASPQQLAGRATNAADDLYSLGATMYELLTGTPPFYRGGIEVVGFQIATQPVVPVMERRAELVEEGANASVGQSVPAAVETTIQACLAKEREARPANAKTVCEALTHGRAAAPSAAASVPEAMNTSPAALGGPTALPQARSPLWRALGALLLLAAAGWGWKALFPPDNRHDKLPSSPEDLQKAAMEQVLKEQAETEKKAKADADRAAGPPAAASVASATNTSTSLTPSEETQHAEWVRIPAGTFEYQKNEKHELPEFWISKHEVTIGEYDEFLTALKKTASGPFDHPEQPKAKTGHTPPNWSALIAAAKNGTIFNGEPLSLNTPVTQVDWFDAYAYAKWCGGRLPSEEEWEKAARGEKGLKYPWGDRDEPGAANLGDDYSSVPTAKGGQIDGHNLSAPTTRATKDVSPYGVCDMAGNVQEWTASETKDAAWPSHPDYPDLRVPVVRGGHFGLKSSSDLLTLRLFPESATEVTAARGFRIARDTPP